MTYETNYLMHHGIKGQKWGVRRYQEEDGSLTAEGKQRYEAERKERIKNIETVKGSKSPAKAFARLLKKSSKGETTKVKKKKPSEMTEEELNAKIKHLELEKKYKQLQNDLSGKDSNNNQNNNQNKGNQNNQNTLRGKLKNVIKDVITDASKIALTSIVQEKANKYLANKRYERAMNMDEHQLDVINNFKVFKDQGYSKDARSMLKEDREKREADQVAAVRAKEERQAAATRAKEERRANAKAKRNENRFYAEAERNIRNADRQREKADKQREKAIMKQLERNRKEQLREYKAQTLSNRYTKERNLRRRNTTASNREWQSFLGDFF